MQEEYVKYCARKGLDPATTLPSLGRLAGTLGTVAEGVGAPKALAPISEAVLDSCPVTPAAPDPTLARSRPAELDCTTISALATRYLDLRCEGYQLKRKRETPDPKSGASFRANSRRNIEATIGLFVDIHGVLPVVDIQDHHCREFAEFGGT